MVSGRITIPKCSFGELMIRCQQLCTAICLVFAGALAQAQDDDARLASARAAYRSGDYAKAIEELEPLLKRDPKKDRNAAVAREYAAGSLHRRGEQFFRRAKVKESLADFDRELELIPEMAAGHWQRGISLYYAKEYEKGVAQFELHQSVNSQDVENAVWHFLCQVRAPDGSVEKARKDLIPIERDGRIPMKEVHEMFAGSRSPEEVLKVAKGAGEDAQFYGDLYVGLYLEALGKPAESLEAIRRAAKNPSAQSHYMGDVARVHVKLRTEESAGKDALK